MQPPRRCLPLMFLIAATAVNGRGAEALIFHDEFKGKLGEGWSWVRENPAGWRISERGLEIRVQPGNMWGGANNARNVLVRPVPDPATGEVIVSLALQNQPTEQYEQVDLVWYYDDSHMVKLGQELVDKKLSIVMGREQADRTRTIAIIPIQETALEVRFLVQTNQIRGQFRTVADQPWRDAGRCDLPIKGSPKVSVQCYQGPSQAEHWARITTFLVQQRQP